MKMVASARDNGTTLKSHYYTMQTHLCANIVFNNAYGHSVLRTGKNLTLATAISNCNFSKELKEKNQAIHHFFVLPHGSPHCESAQQG